jgi:GT2 family glycosyltransferase
MTFSSHKLTLSVIIPVYKGGENFRSCLSSLLYSPSPADEIIVVADGEGDGSWRIAEEFNVKVLRIAGPQGPAHARNRGAQIARGEILFFVDADVTVSPDTTGKMMEIFKKQLDLAAVFGSYDDSPMATNFLSQYKNLLHHYIHQTSDEEASTFWAACGAIKRDIFFSMGGFNETYQQPSIEDIELGYRLKKAGCRIHLCKTLYCKHLKRWSLISLLKSDIFYRGLPWTDLILKKGWWINDLNLRTSSRVSVLLTYGLLGSLIGGGWWALSFVFGGLWILLLLILNGSLYRFYYCRRGMNFMLKAIPLHWLYFFYSGLAFALGSIKYMLCKMKER